jgi:muramoyltetrapeptide carboxypeptidase LdcA involved in peptidoglycan recycling
LIFGEMPGCDEPDGKLTARDTIAAATAAFEGPVLYGFPSGHTRGPLWTLPFGVRVRVVASQEPAVIVEEAPVG